MFLRSRRIAARSAVFGVLFLAACGNDPAGVGPAIGGGAGQAGAAGGYAGGGGTAGAGAGQGGAAGSLLDVAGSAGLGGGAGGLAGGAGAAGAAGSAGAGGAPVVIMLDDALRARVEACVKPLQAWYRNDTGLFDQNDWWTSGNELTSIIDYTRETGDQQYIADIDNTFQKNKGSNFNRYGYFDDDGWWALVWIRAYDLTKQQAYLDMAKTIFQRMAGSWDDNCGGGIYWRGNPKDKKNAISNSLFMQAAAGLHQRIPGDSGAGSYLDWAQRTWTWFKGTGMLRADHLVTDTLDGLNTCKAAGNVFSYNQGVLIGALVELADSTGDTTMLDEADAIAHASMTSPTLTNADGVMVEPCGINTVDCWQFKGIFFRNLLELYRVRPAKDIQAYARKQSDTIWNVSKNAQDQIGYNWQVAFDGASARRQSSGLDALTTAYAVSSPFP